MNPATAPTRHMITVHLGGALGRRFGREWQVMAGTASEAIRGVNTNLKGKLVEYLLTEGRERHYKVALGKTDQLLSGEEMWVPCGTQDVYVWPAFKGCNSGWVKIVVGVALVALTLWNPAGWAAISTLSAGGVSVGGGILGAGTFSLGWAGAITFGIGTSLILGGISQLLAPNRNQGGGLQSNSFQGAIAGGQQGGSVPVCYGKALVTPTPISIWFNAVDWNTTANAYLGTLQVEQLPGGGYEYVSVGANPIINQGS